MSEIDATKIEFHLRSRLRQRRRVRRKSGIVELAEAGDRAPGVPSPSAHLQRCSEKEALSGQSMRWSGFSVILKSLFRPHYMIWSEQQMIELHAPIYLRNVIRIITETGLRIYKELAPLRKEDVDLANKLIFIADSKTPPELPRSISPISRWRRSAARLRSLAPDRGCFEVRRTPSGIRRISIRFQA